MEAGHREGMDASPWVTRFAGLIAPGGSVLDLACGRGRHARWLAARGLKVLAVDRDAEALASLAGTSGVDTLQADLEGADWPLAGRVFDAVVVTNYLFRPHFDDVLANVRDGGLFVYETFMVGNERYGRPANPHFLLRPGELLQRVEGRFTVVAFEQGVAERPCSAVIQRLCAVKGSGQGVALPPA